MSLFKHVRVVVATGVLISGVALAVAAPPVGAGLTATVGVASSMTIIHPSDAEPPTPRPTSTALVMARNEAESFQIVVRAPNASPLGAVTASVTNAGGLNVRLNRVAYYTVTSPPSDCEAYPGYPNSTACLALNPAEWADPLVPAIDPMYGETRSAFPMAISASRNGMIWVDVFAPAGTTPGVHSGTITISNGAAVLGTISFSADVLGFDLPTTSSLQTFIGEDAPQVCSAHAATGLNCTLLHSLYRRVGLENRISISYPWGLNSSGASFATYVRAPLILGTGQIPGIPASAWNLTGARLTTVGLYTYANQCTGTCITDAYNDAIANGYVNRMVAYGCDEPHSNAAAWRACRTSMNTALASVPAGANRRVFATATRAEYDAFQALPEADFPELDILVPNIKFLAPRATYDSWVGADADNEVWIYHACDSFGCASTDAAEPTYSSYDGWAGPAIEALAVQQRAVPWLAYKYKATGELYWEAFHTLPTAWTNQWSDRFGQNFGEHGDGNLFYPGRACPAGTGAGCIGGTHDIPIESVRLKRIRDGQEDFEYMKWLTDRGKGAQVEAIVNGLLPAMNSATIARDGTGTGTMSAARDQLIGLIRTELGVQNPPTQEILFSSDRITATNPTGDTEIFAMNADGTGVLQLTNNTVADKFPVWNPNGTSLAWTSWASGHADIWRMNINGTGAQNLTPVLGNAASKPAYRSDGAEITFVVTNGAATDLWRMNADGTGQSGVITLSTGGTSAYDPAYLPGGPVVFSQDSGQGADLLSYTTGPATTLIIGGSSIDEVPDAGHANGRISFSRLEAGATAYDVWVATAAGANPINLTPGTPTSNEFQSSFSATDARLAYVSSVSGNLDIWAMNADGSAKLNLTNNGATDLDPDWKPAPTTTAICSGRAVSVNLALGQVPTVGNDVILGTSGADVINALAGDDVVCAGAGNDTINPGPGNDTVAGEAGSDLVTYAGATAGVTVSLAIATPQNTVGSGIDSLVTVERLSGSGRADVLTGNAVANTLNGGGGNDTIKGGNGNDRLAGGAGDDTLDGEVGVDVCDGGIGAADTAVNCETTLNVP